MNTNKSDNLDEMDKLLETHNLLQLNDEEIGHVNRPMTGKETETVIR